MRHWNGKRHRDNCKDENLIKYMACEDNMWAGMVLAVRKANPMLVQPIEGWSSPVLLLPFFQLRAVGDASEALECQGRCKQEVLQVSDTRASQICEAVENSLLPMSLTTLSRVRPWDLWIETAQGH